jgi:hypothetical protein
MPRPAEIIRNSRTYQVVLRIRRWADGSILVRLLTDERVLTGLLGLFILLSLIRILASDMHASIKFLSFALMFVVLTALTWNYTEPFPDA